MTSAVYVFDFTLVADFDGVLITPEELIEQMWKFAKKWAFQLEVGQLNGLPHYQGRFSLRVKRRLLETKDAVFPEWFWVHLSPTTREHQTDFDYVAKEETRVKGPWTFQLNPKPVELTAELRKFDKVPLYSWQADVEADLLKVDCDDRHINFILDPGGCQGKSTFCKLMLMRGHAEWLPAFNDYKDLVRCAMSLAAAAGKAPNAYLIDLARAMNKNKLGPMFHGVETLKQGVAFDERYEFQRILFDPPKIWFFANQMPELFMLSLDRWIFWFIHNGCLVRFYPKGITCPPGGIRSPYPEDSLKLITPEEIDLEQKQEVNPEDIDQDAADEELMNNVEEEWKDSKGIPTIRLKKVNGRMTVESVKKGRFPVTVTHLVEGSREIEGEPNTSSNTIGMLVGKTGKHKPIPSKKK